MPEQMLEKLKKSITTQWKVCFFAALIVGFIAHFYKITNWLPNWDSLVFRYDSQNMIRLGRWFLPVACAPSSFYDLPWINGLLSVVYHALGAVCIVKMFGVRKNITAGLIGAAVITFPTVTSVMMYNYVADGYGLAFLFSCIAAMLLIREKPKFVLAVIFIALSAGIYQAYITVTITLLLVHLILELLYKRMDLKKSLGKCVRFLLAGGVGMALYYLVLTVLLKLTGTELLEYQGLDSAVSLTGLDIFGSLYTTKEAFLGYFFDFSQGISTFTLINCVIFALIFGLYLTDLIKNKISISKIVLLFVYVALLPIGATILAFINSGVDYHNLMKMGFFAFYLLLILQYEKTELKSIKMKSTKMWLVLGVMVALIFNQVVIANVSYHKLNMAYDKAHGILIRIADRIEQNEEARNCKRILVVGALPDSESYSVNLPPDMTGTTDGLILRADDETVGQSVVCSALNDYCGKNYTFLAKEEKEAILKKIDKTKMENWPDKSAILVVDDVIVLKLGDEKEQ